MEIINTNNIISMTQLVQYCVIEIRSQNCQFCYTDVDNHDATNNSDINNNNNSNNNKS